ncbi:MAG: hypothetical protein R2865_01735 [Deinococcales bacterium]
MPLSLFSYSYSFPSAPLLWAVGIGFLDIAAFFALGQLLMRLLKSVRLMALAPISIMLLVMGVVGPELRFPLPSP